eukprot:Gb_02761 [translate_table: standard]
MLDPSGVASLGFTSLFFLAELRPEAEEAYAGIGNHYFYISMLLTLSYAGTTGSVLARTGSNSPNVSFEGERDADDTRKVLAQALQEKVAALLLLSQQEERHLLEKNTNAALHEKIKELQQKLLQVNYVEYALFFGVQCCFVTVHYSSSASNSLLTMLFCLFTD